MTASALDLATKRILIVEDEYLTAVELRDQLESNGAEVLGPVATLKDAMRIIAAERLDAAVLDVNLAGEAADPAADALVSRHIPFIFATGYECQHIAKKYPDTPCHTKPVNPSALAAQLAARLRKR